MFKQRKHKTFNYQPRFSNEEEKDSNLEERTEKEFVSKWKRERSPKSKMGLSMSIRTLILVLVLLLICMYILDSKFG
ncbi:hypothetical protein [Wocania ichthyoenteri]|uniref:hypothetical protein n=1 Tax=Wocania ichthyoenteri TaxID=1230531 RepID=UPI00053E9289|nr:hypothetical protein [Wocania ichthyoenteri]